MGLVERPNVFALLFCDSVYACPQTGKTSFLGCWSYLFIPAVPFAMPNFVIVAGLTDGRGDFDLCFEIAPSDDSQPLFSRSIRVSLADPHEIKHVGVGCQGVVFPALGSYRLDIWIGDRQRGDLLMTRRIGTKQHGGEP